MMQYVVLIESACSREMGAFPPVPLSSKEETVPVAVKEFISE